MLGISDHAFVFNHHMFNPYNASPNSHAYNDDAVNHTWPEGVKATPSHDPSVIIDHARAKVAGPHEDMMAM
jgi:hypothetical protein